MVLEYIGIGLSADMFGNIHCKCFIAGIVPYLTAVFQHLSERAGQGWSAEDTSRISTANDTSTAGHHYNDSWCHDC